MTLKESYYAFMVFSFAVVCWISFLYMFMVCLVKRLQVWARGSYSRPMKKKHLTLTAWTTSFAFSSVTILGD